MLVQNMLFSGFIIGVILSAPMGPTGMYIVQRTMQKGRLYGLSCGLGAALSDVLYCALTAFCMSFVQDFVDSNEKMIKIGGSAVMLIFAIYLMRSNPAKAIKPSQADNYPTSYWSDFTRGFSITVVNFGIFILTLTLFSRFEFMSGDLPWYIVCLGLITIFAGATTWWFFITYIVHKLRSHLNSRSMWIMNLIMGIILFIVGIYGLIVGIKQYLTLTELSFL